MSTGFGPLSTRVCTLKLHDLNSMVRKRAKTKNGRGVKDRKGGGGWGEMVENKREKLNTTALIMVIMVALGARGSASVQQCSVESWQSPPCLC